MSTADDHPVLSHLAVPGFVAIGILCHDVAYFSCPFSLFPMSVCPPSTVEKSQRFTVKGWDLASYATLTHCLLILESSLEKLSATGKLGTVANA